MELTPGDWLQFGAMGLVVLSVIVGWLTPGRQTEREQQRADRLEEENARLRQVAEDRTIPLLIRAMDVLERSQELDRRGGVPPLSQRFKPSDLPPDGS